jgi:hypothetical protein
MRLVGAAIIALGSLWGSPWLSGVALAQSLEVEQDQAHQAPGVEAWLGRIPSPEELQAVLSEASARAQAQTGSAAEVEEPDFQNERVKVYMGRIPSLESLRKLGQ